METDPTKNLNAINEIIQEAVVYINGIIQEIAGGGNNDSEISTLSQLIKELKDGKYLSVDEAKNIAGKAKNRAFTLSESRQESY